MLDMDGDGVGGADVDDGEEALVEGAQQFAYVLPLEKFVYVRDGAWQLNESVKADGIKHFLDQIGWDNDTIIQVLAERRYLKVSGWDMMPNEPPIVTKGEHAYINTWVKPTLGATPGTYPVLEEALMWLTDQDAAGVHWIKNWIAAKVQQPTLVPKVALCFASEQGAGKGILAATIRKMLGWRNTEQVGTNQLENKFNSRWAGKLFVLADEVKSTEKSKDISSTLKILVDASEIELEGKGKDQRSVKNRIAWMFASNNTVSPIVLERGDRRYTVFANHAPLEEDYKARLLGCFEADRETPTAAFCSEMEAFHYEMQNWKVERAKVSTPYKNTARETLIEASTPTHDFFFQHVAENGIEDLLNYVIGFVDPTLSKTRKEWDFGEEGVSIRVVYQCYVEFCSRINGHPMKLNRFGVAVKNHHPRWPPNRKYAASIERQVNLYVIPRGAPKDAKQKDEVNA